GSGWDGSGSHPTVTAIGLDEVLAAVDEVERAVRADRAVAA
ncbi:glycosyl transferase, partial [Micromonospora craterilacus]